MMHARAGLWVAIGCSLSWTIPCAVMAQTPPPVSPSPTTRYEYDAMGHVTKILRGASGDSTSIAYDGIYRITSITDARLGAIRFEYWGMTPYINKVIDPRGLETSYERTGMGHLLKIVSPDTGTTVFTYVPGTMLVKTALDSRGVLTSYTYDASERLTRTEFSAGGRSDPALIFTYSERGPEFPHGIGRLTSTRHGSGGDRYGYDDQGDVSAHTQWLDPAVGANGSTVRLEVVYARPLGNLEGITYPSGRRLVIARDAGQAMSMALAKDGASQPVPLVSDIQWAPFAMGINGWKWHTSAGLVPHQRAFDLSGRMVRYPIGRVLRDVRYDAQDRIAAFTHQLVGGGAQPALDQQFGYDELDRLTRVVTATTSWSIAYDPNSNRASLSLDGVPSRYDTEPASNRLRGVTNPARSLAHDDAGNTTSDSAGYTATYDLAGQLSTLTKGGVTTTYTYNAMGQRIRKVNSTGPQSTVIYVYDQEGQLLGEYDRDGRAIREYVWLQGVPIAVFTPNPADANGPPLVFHIHADHLNAPRAVLDTDGVIRWLWLAEPFGTTAPVVDPGGRGPFAFSLRFPGQVADAESGLFYNWNRYYNPVDGRYTQSDPIGLAGGSLSTYGYVNGNPLMYVDPYGLFGMDDVWGTIYVGTGGWSPSQQLVDFGGGFGDVVTFGMTRQARTFLDIEGVNRCSKWYTAGEVAGIVAAMSSGYVAGTRSFARHASPNNWSNFSHSGTPASWQRGSWWSRAGNRANGDYIPTTGARPDLHDLMDATAAGIGGTYKTWPAWRRLPNRMPYTPGAALYGGASAALNVCECGN